jgi:tRNA C32,U32 (ribose-2'-O)-methylase TrmJ
MRDRGRLRPTRRRRLKYGVEPLAPRQDASVHAQQIAEAFDDVFDQAIVFHGFTDCIRDYDVIVYATADPRTGIEE